MDYTQNEWLYGILCEYGFDEAVNAFKENIAKLGFESQLASNVETEIGMLGKTTVNRDEYVKGRVALCEKTMRDMYAEATDVWRRDRYYIGNVIYIYVLAETVKAALLERANIQPRPAAVVRQAENNEPKKKAKPKPTFASIIQYPNKESVLERLHGLIDGKSGADVGAVLLKARIDGYLTRNPTQAEFTSEFELIGTWSSIANYMSDNNANALDRANKILIRI